MSTADVLGRTAAAEWSRIWTVRSSWLLTVAAAVVVLGLSTLLGFDARDGFGDELPAGGAWDGVRFTALPGMFVLVALAAVLGTADHATGGIVPTLQWTPRRGVLLAARVAVVVTTVTAIGVALIAVGGVLVRWIVPEVGLPVDPGLELLGRVAYADAAAALLAVGLGLALRSTAGAMVGVFGLILVLPLLIGNLPFEWAQDLAAYLPGTSAIHLLLEDGPTGMSMLDAHLRMGVWALGALVVGGWRLVRTDANR